MMTDEQTGRKPMFTVTKQGCMNVCPFHIEKEAFPAFQFIHLLKLCLCDLIREIIYSLDGLIVNKESEGN